MVTLACTRFKFTPLLSSILNKAKKWQFLEMNPCQYIEAPKSKSKTMPIYEEDELINFLHLLLTEAKTKYQLFFLLAFSTGLRRSELLGLRYEDIDMDKLVVHVNQAAIVVKGKGIQYKDPKTEKSAAGVSFSPSILPILKKHLQEQTEQKNLPEQSGMKIIYYLLPHWGTLCSLALLVTG